MIRRSHLKKDQPSLGIVDAKSIKNTDTAQEKGYDAGMKMSGIKLHIVVDTLGLPHAMYITTANVTNRDGAIKMISSKLKDLSSIESLNSGYRRLNKQRSVFPSDTALPEGTVSGNA